MDRAPESFQIGLALGLGDLVLGRAQLDPVVAHCREVRVGFAREILHFRSARYRDFATRFARLIFDCPPYVVVPGLQATHCTDECMYIHFGARPQWPRLANVLCAGPALHTERPYVVLNTKVRFMPRKVFDARWPELLRALQSLAQRYQLVLLGEQEMEPSREYREHGPGRIYSIYSELSRSLELTDLTIGTFSPDHEMRLAQLRQDCTYIRDAVASVHIGIGGGFVFSAAVGKPLCVSGHEPIFVDAFLRQQAPHGCLYTTNWDELLGRLAEI